MEGGGAVWGWVFDGGDLGLGWLGVMGLGVEGAVETHERELGWVRGFALGGAL